MCGGIGTALLQHAHGRIVIFDMHPNCPFPHEMLSMSVPSTSGFASQRNAHCLVIVILAGWRVEPQGFRRARVDQSMA